MRKNTVNYDENSCELILSYTNEQMDDIKDLANEMSLSINDYLCGLLNEVINHKIDCKRFWEQRKANGEDDFICFLPADDPMSEHLLNYLIENDL